MKINLAKYFLIFTWILLSFLSGCKKEAAKVNSFFPTVITTDTVTNITATSATSGGEISSDGGAAVLARGVCWSSTNPMPTLWDSKTNDGTGTGSFTSSITGLTTGTTYYVRAYASNSRGTAYGNEISFIINDYLPLTVGAKYKYNYSDRYGYIDGGYIKKGECSWEFISMAVGTTVVYLVEQSFTGDYVSYQDYGSGPIHKDSIHYENQISALSFEVQNDGKVTFHFLVPYFGAGKVTFERFIQSEKTDTCFLLTLYSQGCLRKNVGIKDLDYTVSGNHHGSVSYSLIEGPSY
jgi:hypothetical protein